ncbi:MAG: hypothetical protein A2X86_17405 [Bdellovibrionales bacterium GWA2_49_15]|nr:MAG: hypothetical protein A2X86_17405 [Bdellovibrionales bacterium GWA2_49_15]HAZ13983.1 hypothetical protein [Bdellovibrionales bacterium]
MKTYAFRSIIKAMDVQKQKGLLALGISLFLVLLSYPILRSTTTGLFLHYFGAQHSPNVWFYSVLAIMVCVFFYDRAQRHWPLFHLYNATVLLSVGIFFVGLYLLSEAWEPSAYLLFVWKEAYIVLLVHMIFGVANASLRLDEAKVFYGPLGALGSFGGIFGGLLTGWLTYYFSTETILGIGVIFVILSGVAFYAARGLLRLEVSKNILSEQSQRPSPLMSLNGVGKYVMLLCLVVALSQFVINLANFKFDVLFTALVPDKDLKTRYLGHLYTLVNSIGLILQIVVLPYVLAQFSRRRIHLFVPILFLLLAITGLIFGSAHLMLVSFAFGTMKGTDYSLFSAVKELMYYALGPEQKYGAKYVVDMVVYRFSKGLISVFLIFFQMPWLIDGLLVALCIIWFVLIFPLFNEERKISRLES